MDSDARPDLRRRRREGLIEEIVIVARQHLAEHGATQLSLRAVARQIGIAPSALYRYFPSREDLLTALIARTYIDIDQTFETAVESALAAHPTDLATAWVETTSAYRRWALAHQAEFGLVYGNPIPGYAAPENATREVGRRAAVALFRIILVALEDGRADVAGLRARGRHMSPSMLADLAEDASHRGLEMSQEQAAGLMAYAYAAWSTLQGLIAMELFGHLPALRTHAEEFFRAQSLALVETMLR